MDFLSGIKKFDTFGKSKEHVQVRTASGAAVSQISIVLMVILLISEFRYYLRVHAEDHIVVDTSQGDRDFPITLDLSFFALKCADLDLKLEDQKGLSYDDAKVHVRKTPVAADGITSGVPAAEAVGCRVQGTLNVKKVAGNFHVAAGRPSGMADGHFSYTLSHSEFEKFNASHTINHLAFGPHFPGQLSPLDGHGSANGTGAGAQFQYHIKVVPTLYEKVSGSLIDSQQYSATEFFQESDITEGVLVQPGVWFRYDFSPIMVRRVETRQSFISFLTSVCAILGGVHVLSGLLDQVFYRFSESRKGK